MIKELSSEDFRKNNNISEEKWEKADINWEDLKSIGLDHEDSIPDLNGIAEFIANTLQKCKSVHSVKWRIKDSEHLMEKIVRKRAEDSEKYVDIDITNYSSKITDLVGVRVLHLFKNEQLKIDEYLCSKWKPEDMIIYIREGDEKKEDKDNKESKKVEDKNDKELGRIEIHPNGYRSTHYIISSKPTLKEVFSEIQVRTIFEEGWSEIDHKIRYPNFSNNHIISYFLDIFNRIAGTADEMGDFLNELTLYISSKEDEIISASNKENKLLSNINDLVSRLDDKNEIVKELKNNFKELKSNNNPYNFDFLNTNSLKNIKDMYNFDMISQSKNLEFIKRISKEQESFNNLMDPLGAKKFLGKTKEKEEDKDNE